MRKFFFSLMLALPMAAGAQGFWEGSDYTVTKISNPACGEREADGLITGGDRENSYTWRLAMRGDEIYIATARNIASALVNLYGSAITSASGMSMDAFWAMIDAVTNGDILRNDVSEGANIISYNRKTGEFKVVWTGDKTEFQRMAVTFGDNVYFGSYSADPTVVQYILKLDPDGNFTKVFETTGCPAIRANCVYDGHLFFASVDDRTVVAEGDEAPIVKMAVLRKSNDDDTVWECVADYKDFGAIPYDPIQANWAGAPFWEMASHNGYIYATAPSTAGFVIFKGRPAQGGESANEYGWHWEEVAGVNNGINNPGLCDIEGGQPGTMRSLIGSVFEFNGELYAYDFDHAFGGEAKAFVGMLQQLTGNKDAKASDYLDYMYNSLQNPQRVWKLDDATGKFSECEAFTKLMEGTTNEYIWRMGEYDGKLYIATMDAGIFYNYLTQLTNGSFFRMSTAEKLTKVQYLATVINNLAQAKGDEKIDALSGKLAQLKDQLAQYVSTEQVDEETIQYIIDLQGIIHEINSVADTYLQGQIDELVDKYADLMISVLEQHQAIDEMQVASIITLLNLLQAGYIESLWQQFKDAITGEDGDAAREAFKQNIKDALALAMGLLKATAEDILDRIDVKGIEMYSYINNAVKANEWGFDLIRTADGENFEVITRTGFDDKYNYGCPSFLATDEGLYFGTCNPFYGGQLFLLSNKGNEAVGISETIAPDASPSGLVYTLSGQRVSGQPARAGVYIKDGRKVVTGR